MVTRTSFWSTNLGKTIKAASYIAVSAVLGYVITATTDSPQLFGALTGLINILLVFVKQTWFNDTTRNVGAN